MTPSETCSGKDEDGNPCTCRRAKLAKNQKDDEPAICINCSHYDTSHPDDTKPMVPVRPDMLSMVRSYTGQFRADNKAKTSEENARRETNTGFLKMDALEVKKTASRSDKGKFTSVKKNETDLKKECVGTVAIITCGIDEKNQLEDSTAPDPSRIDSLLGVRLAARNDGDGDPIRFKGDMTTKDIDRYLRILFPELFEHLDEHTSVLDGHIHWVLLTKSYHKLSVCGTDEPGGAEFQKKRSPAGRKWSDQCVFVATKREISDEVYTKWGSGTAKSEPDDDCGDSADSSKEVIQPKHSKRASKRPASPLFIDSNSDDEPDVVKESKKRQRKRKKIAFDSPKFSKLAEDNDDDLAIMAGIEASLHDIDGQGLDFIPLLSPLIQVDPEQNIAGTVSPTLAVPAVLAEASISTQPLTFLSGAASGRYGQLDSGSSSSSSLVPSGASVPSSSGTSHNTASRASSASSSISYHGQYGTHNRSGFEPLSKPKNNPWAQQ